MSKFTFATIVLSCVPIMAAASTTEISGTQTSRMVQFMIDSCRTEIKALPALTMGRADGEAIWNNLEMKEKSGRLSADCDVAEDAYEKQFHYEIWQAEAAKERASGVPSEISTVQALRIVQFMIDSCKTEIKSQAPLRALRADGETIWNNLEAKEKLGKLSADCDIAEDAYEKQFHYEIWQAEEAKERKN